MAMKSFTLSKKIALTPDVFELHFNCSEDFELQAGQFITFILPEIGGRAYSVLKHNGKETVLLIKRVEQEIGGRGGSMMICDTEVGDTLNGAGPAGHFVLTEGNNNKLFIGTGTGLVPLYNQIRTGLARGDSSQYTLLFGVRTGNDVFYQKQFKSISDTYPNFEYKIYLSREDKEGYTQGYITDYLNQKNSKSFDEFYICGAPVMVDSAVEKLELSGITQEKIFTEKY